MIAQAEFASRFCNCHLPFGMPEYRVATFGGFHATFLPREYLKPYWADKDLPRSIFTPRVIYPDVSIFQNVSIQNESFQNGSRRCG